MDPSDEAATPPSHKLGVHVMISRQKRLSLRRKPDLNLTRRNARCEEVQRRHVAFLVVRQSDEARVRRPSKAYMPRELD